MHQSFAFRVTVRCIALALVVGVGMPVSWNIAGWLGATLPVGLAAGLGGLLVAGVGSAAVLIAANLTR